MRIDCYITQDFVETENLFKDTILVMIDVLRAGTSICAALHNGAKEVVAVESLERASRIYNNLSRETRFLGGERNCIKPTNFDAGNSPSEYSGQAVKGKSVIITTTNGTKLFQKGKQAKQKIIGGFVNMDIVIKYLKNVIDSEKCNVTFLCAGNDGRLSYEDLLCAGSFISELSNSYFYAELSDTAHLAMTVFDFHSMSLEQFIKEREHSRWLMELGLSEDIEISLTRNMYPVLPVISGNIIKV